MDFEELKKLASEGKKIDAKTWSKLTKDQQKEIMECRKKSNGGPRRNDYSWYAISEQLAKDVASLPYNVMSGVGFIQNVKVYATGGTITEVNPTQKEQSVFRVGYIPACGKGSSKTSGVNMAATLLYTAVRRNNSGARNYEAADLMMYILAMRDIYREILEARRLIGIIGLYDIENHYLPDMLIRALGFDPLDIRQNIALYRGQLNLLIKKANAFAVPKYFKIFDRTTFISTNVFVDSSSIRGQFYVLDADYRYVFSATASELGSSLVATAKYSTSDNKKFSDKLNAIAAMLDAMFLDSDINTMSGDIARAFDANNLYSLIEVDEKYTITPVLDEDILAQIENSFSVGSYTSQVGGGVVLTNIDVTQNEQIITFRPSLLFQNATNMPFLRKFYFNSHLDDVDYRNNLEWSRLMSIPDIDTLTATGVELIFGSELVTSYNLSRYNSDDSILIVPINNIQFLASDRANGALAVLTQYDWHPCVYYFTQLTANNVTLIGAMDLKKYTIIEGSTLNAMHDCACTALLWSDSLYQASVA